MCLQGTVGYSRTHVIPVRVACGTIHHSPGCSLSRCVDHRRGQVLIFTEMCQGIRVQLTRHGSMHAAMITVVSRPLPVMTVTTRLAPSASMVLNNIMDWAPGPPLQCTVGCIPQRRYSPCMFNDSRGLERSVYQGVKKQFDAECVP